MFLLNRSSIYSLMNIKMITYLSIHSSFKFRIIEHFQFKSLRMLKKLHAYFSSNILILQVRWRRIECLLQCDRQTRSCWKWAQSGIDSRQPPNINDSESNLQRAFRQNIFVGRCVGWYGREQRRHSDYLHAVNS